MALRLYKIGTAAKMRKVGEQRANEANPEIILGGWV